MTRDRIDNASEARHLLDQHPRRRPQHVRPDDSVGDRPVHALGATGMNGVEVDLDMLRATEAKLATLHDDLVAQMTDATRLAGPLRDGSSPITGPMRTAFFERADAEAGVQATLRHYLLELLKVRQAIMDTLRSYAAVDSEAVALLGEQTARLEQGVGNGTRA
ncbi:MAG TPA: hypothetical protein VFV67_03610 [Actinophytocola sp.]|uniref:hypothetical protein n=1 Tax=Actinophytocola sp. TaxID=1872138 RepID=UPI002DC00284|nr:hypothetical protein [Actinophytocola sp.]HEU5469715.1 hypothetical protein [Actinophytocola sp.]